MKRKADWIDRLVAYLESVNRTPFEWGKHDCFLFCMGAVDAMRGNKKLYKHFAGRCFSENDVAKLCKEEGYKSAIDFMTKNFPPRESKFQIQRGDIVAFDGDQGLTFGIWQGQRIYAAGPDGLMTLDGSLVRAGYAV